MAQVQRANVYLTIEEAEIPKYLAKGFNLLDASGRVVKQSVPTDIGTLQKAFTEHVAEISKLKSEIQALKSAGVKKTPAKAEVKEPEPEEEGWDDWSDAEEVEDEKPRNKAKNRK